LLAISLVAVSCNDAMDLSPKDRVSAETILSSEDGVRVWMANLYYQAPFEDFNYNRVGQHSGRTNTVGIYWDQQTGNAVNSEFNHLIDGGGNYTWWGSGYAFMRDVNYLMSVVPTLDVLSDSKKEEILAEGHFLRAFGYFKLAKTYGGVPIIEEYQTLTEDPTELQVARSTEQETWDYVLAEFDKAIAGLPESRSGSDQYRASKWIAYAMKSRAALFAASVAKFWNKAPLEGEAVDLGLVGLDSSLASKYYSQCMEACQAVMNSGKYSLYKPNPASTDEAMNNILKMFQDPTICPEEAICVYAYDPASSTTYKGHCIDFWCNPYQTRDGGPHPGRMNPTLDLADVYEYYDKPGQDGVIVTTRDGNTSDYNGFSASTEYLRFDTPYQIFEGKDVRMWATFILPGTEWKGQTIRIQAGYVKPDGTPVIEADKASIEVNGVTYHTFGAASMDDYSGFDQSNYSCMTRTGFSFKKFLSPTTVENNNNLGVSSQAWMEIRYAEILLNYAEAVVESGSGDKALAKQCLNATRRRAGHTTDIELTSENVQRERRVEFAFENKRWYDLIRRREFHEVFDNTMQHALDPVLDLRVDPPKYIFIRKDILREVRLDFDEKYYYNSIPGTANNGCVQNPKY